MVSSCHKPRDNSILEPAITGGLYGYEPPTSSAEETRYLGKRERRVVAIAAIIRRGATSRENWIPEGVSLCSRATLQCPFSPIPRRVPWPRSEWPP